MIEHFPSCSPPASQRLKRKQTYNDEQGWAESSHHKHTKQESPSHHFVCKVFCSHILKNHRLSVIEAADSHQIHTQIDGTMRDFRAVKNDIYLRDAPRSKKTLIWFEFKARWSDFTTSSPNLRPKISHCTANRVLSLTYIQVYSIKRFVYYFVL